MVDAVSDLSGSQRAAIFLLGVGEEGAASIMRHMAPKEVQRVGEAMAKLSDISDEQISAVVREFSEKVSQVNPIGIGASDFTKRVMVQALGENRARTMLNKVMQGSSGNGLDALKWMDARAVANLIKNEHPQIIAIVLTSLDDDHAAQVLSMLPESLRTNVVLRIAKLDMIDPAALHELDQVLEKQLGMTQDVPPARVDGMSSAAAILNHLDSEQEADLLEAMKLADSELGEKIQELMFVFDNLNALDDRGFQRLIREIAVDSLVIALKGVDPQLQNKFFKNMSSRAAEMLKEDLESKGPVKLSEVEAAQKEILTIAARLSDEGEIFLGKGGGDFV
ncbi:MAG: flagellar motor switch protein FliG [Porticoccaceae bacterium]|nr:flagellar motor switch protein FliG [Pseudomonadales bacterium]MCP5173027.1 flagellar motor switch protein FliG [Pseudomonadales bacterium]MCP5302501.1 flagellar motor switch protein FliG [Pseudomonadales bacterium]